MFRGEDCNALGKDQGAQRGEATPSWWPGDSKP